MNQVRSIYTLTALSLTMLVLGCVPEKTRVIWSPDGSQAIVIAADGLHLCSPDGKLSLLLIKDAKYAEWLPDSRRAIVHFESSLSSWSEVSKLVSDESRQRIVDLAGKMRTEALAYTGPWDKFEEALTEKVGGIVLFKYGIAASVYLQEQNDPALREKLAAQWKDFLEVRVPCSMVQQFELTPTAAKPGPILLQWAVERLVSNIRVSPDGRNVAISYVTMDYAVEHRVNELSTSRSLGVVPTDASAPFRQISELTSLYVDWTPDSRYLVFGRTEAEDPRNSDSDANVRLGAVSRHRVADLEGKPPEDFKNEDLAGVLYFPTMRVRCLKDGRILFSSTEVQLPATARDMPDKQSLFALDPLRQSTVTNLIPRGSLAAAGGLTQYFEVSPDENFVSLLNAQGRVSVLTLATGEITSLQDKDVPGQSDNVDPKPRIIPTWRAPDQLTFARPVDSPEPGRPTAEIVLVTMEQKQHTVLSAGWPKEAVQGFLLPPPTSSAQISAGSGSGSDK